jgi:hypothetical protein
MLRADSPIAASVSSRFDSCLRSPQQDGKLLMRWAVMVVSPEGIDHGKARPKADAVWLMS